VIKKGLALTEAENYRDTLMKIGLAVEILDANGNSIAEAQATDPLEIVPEELAAEAVAEPVPPTGPTGVLSDIELSTVTDETDSGFRCPKCSLPQDATEQCIGCGVYVEKYQAAQGAYGMAGSTTSASGRTGGQAGKKTRAASVEVEDDSLSITGLAFATFAAIAGAFAWYLIATMFDYELGFVAWGIGGLIGLAAALGGSRSDAAGVACGVLLVVLAIFGGKYMAMSSIAAEYQAMVSGDASDPETMEMFEEFQFDASSFARIDANDENAVKTFMVDHWFIDAESSASVTSDDLDYFRTEFQPGLEDQIASPMNFEQWHAGMMGNVDAVFQDISPVSMVIDTLGPMDILFLLLGVSTAFQLARRGRDT